MKPWDQRSGVWVETPAGVGIVHIERNGVFVHMVRDDDGTTFTIVPLDSVRPVRQARRTSIPAVRRQGVPDHRLAMLGYH